MEQKSNTKRLVVLAFLIALEIILTRFCSIQTPIVRIGFGFLPVAMMGILYGPIWAGSACRREQHLRRRGRTSGRMDEGLRMLESRDLP